MRNTGEHRPPMTGTSGAEDPRWNLPNRTNHDGFLDSKNSEEDKGYLK